VTYGSLGVVHWSRGDMNAVRESYDKALVARRGIEDAILEGRILNGLGSTNLRTGDYEAAVRYYREAVDLRRRSGDIGGLCTSLTYLGNAYYQMNRLIEARECFEEALPELERSGRPDQMIQILNSMANLNTEMGRWRAANEAYLRAIDIAAGANSPVDEATCRINLADNYQRAGKYSEALEQLDIAAERLETSPEPYRLVDLYYARTLVYLNMGELDLARDTAVTLRQQAQTLGEPTYTINAQIVTAQIYAALGAYDRGLKAANEAIAAARESQLVRLERGGEVTAARLDASAGNAESSIAHWNKALEIDERDGAQSAMLESRLGLAGALALRGDFDDARARYREIIPVAREAGLPAFLAVSHLGIAHTYETENPDSAEANYAAALAYYERGLRDLGGAEATAAFLSGERRFVYEEVARYYAKLYAAGRGQEWSDRAFTTIESAKARGLLDLLRTAQARESTEEEDALLDSIYTLRAAGTADAEALDKLEKQYMAMRNARVEKSVGAMEAGQRIASLADVRKQLDKGTVVLSYALGDTASLVWAIDRKGSTLKTLPGREPLRRTVSQLRDAISRPGAGDETLRSASRALYVDLIAPVEEWLAGARRVVVIPDGVLFELPFEVLLSEEPQPGAAWKDLAFAARRYPMVYAASASTFLAIETRGGDRKYDLDLLALGDPAYTAESGLALLPYTRDEVVAISADVKDKRKAVLVGADANETALRTALETHHPRIVHLAAHGLVDPHDPSASSIALCEPDGGADDGYLHTLEIISLPLDVGLVVLSACESARGQLSRSEGVVGLSRAFVASGAEGVVASLWSVSDQSTASLMKEFYGRMIGKKESAATALSHARLALLDSPEYSHPFHWAPFIAIGMQGAPW
jgi:CHAT domain-containing protein